MDTRIDEVLRQLIGMPNNTELVFYDFKGGGVRVERLDEYYTLFDASQGESAVKLGIFYEKDRLYVLAKDIVEGKK